VLVRPLGDVIVRQGDGYVLRSPGSTIDAVEFEHACRAARLRGILPEPRIDPLLKPGPFVGGLAAVLKALNVVSLVILLIVTLILANTLSMSVRERTHEYGVLRAIGFPPGHVRGFILGESLLIALAGGVAGVGLVELVINHALGPLMEANMSGVFQHFFTPGWVLAVALAAAAALGLVAGGVPAILASRLKITDALRRVD
jgi:putative ABC transport system permease protein